MPNSIPPRPTPNLNIEAIEQRVYSTERQIREVADQMSSGFADLRRENAANIDKVTSAVSMLSKDVAERNKVQWPVLTGFGVLILSILGGLGVLSLSPIKDNLAKSDARVEQLGTRIDMVASQYVSRVENDRLRTEDTKRADIVRQQINDDIKQLTEAVNTVTRTFVPRVEAEAIARLQEKLADERAKNTELRLNHHTAILDRMTTK